MFAYSEKYLETFSERGPSSDICRGKEIGESKYPCSETLSVLGNKSLEKLQGDLVILLLDILSVSKNDVLLRNLHEFVSKISFLSG